jgi:argininosuccinate synthase
MVYHAMWLHPLRKDLDAFIDSTQKYVAGEITIRLYKGNIETVKRDSPESLFAPELRSIKRGGFDQREATGAVKVYTLPYGLYGKKRR